MTGLPAICYRPWIITAWLVLSICSAAVGRADEEARLLRFPAIHGDQIVFTYAGDLYSVASQGGVARRLTSDPGFEMFARFSPDGKWLAFTGQYDGNTEVYLMPAAGGVPKRLTYTATLERDDVSDRMGPNNIVMGWSNEKTIIFRSRGTHSTTLLGELYSGVDRRRPAGADSAAARRLVLLFARREAMAYNRIFREFRTWKRYRGGMADDVWIYDFATKTTTNVTKTRPATSFPMWRGDEDLLRFRPRREQAHEPVRPTT